MLSFCFCELSTSDRIHLFVGLIAAIIAATGVYIAYLAYKAGEARNSMDQYKLLLGVLEKIIIGFQSIDFKSLNVSLFPDGYKTYVNQANGLNVEMIYLFQIFEKERGISISDDMISTFWLNVLCPLIRQYYVLLNFLEDEVKDDKFLSENQKNKMYKTVEQSILQSYFRICNNLDITGRNKEYDLSRFSAHKNFSDFYAINEFYKRNNAFTFRDQKFYETTL